MTGGARRTSGEIINATLLEVFLALTFVVFSVAVFEKGERDKADVKADSSAAEAGRLRSTTEELAKARGMIASLAANVDSLTAKSKIPPFCEPDAFPREIVSITLDASDRLTIRATRARFGFAPNTSIAISPAVLKERFAKLEAYGANNHNCRFVARVIDTPRITKTDLKRLCSRIQSVFRVQGCFV